MMQSVAGWKNILKMEEFLIIPLFDNIVSSHMDFFSLFFNNGIKGITAMIG